MFVKLFNLLDFAYIDFFILVFDQEEQKSMQRTVRKIIDEDINPYVDEWEAAGQYPAKKVRIETSEINKHYLNIY